jgi:hypothetical protein
MNILYDYKMGEEIREVTYEELIDSINAAQSDGEEI